MGPRRADLGLGKAERCVAKRIASLWRTEGMMVAPAGAETIPVNVSARRRLAPRHREVCSGWGRIV